MSDRLAQLHKLHEADPADADLPYMIGYEHGKAGDTADAIAWLDKALAIDPHHHYAYFQKAKMLDADGETADALAVIDQGIAMSREASDMKALGELQELRAALGE